LPDRVIFVNLIVVPLGTLSAGELAWQSIRIDKPHIGTETRDYVVEEANDHAADNDRQMNTSQEPKSQKSSKIDTSVFLKKEDKSRL